MSSTRIAYAPRSDTTPESELGALGAVFAFILERHGKKKAAETSGGEDVGKEENHVPATTSSIP